VAQATASLRAEGLTASSDVDVIMSRWSRGEISTTDMRSQVRDLYGPADG